jgi:hypothetical protein
MGAESLPFLIRAIFLVALGSFMVKDDVHKRLKYPKRTLIMHLLPIPRQDNRKDLVKIGNRALILFYVSFALSFLLVLHIPSTYLPYTLSIPSPYPLRVFIPHPKPIQFYPASGPPQVHLTSTSPPLPQGFSWPFTCRTHQVLI